MCSKVRRCRDAARSCQSVSGLNTRNNARTRIVANRQQSIAPGYDELPCFCKPFRRKHAVSAADASSVPPDSSQSKTISVVAARNAMHTYSPNEYVCIALLATEVLHKMWKPPYPTTTGGTFSMAMKQRRTAHTVSNETIGLKTLGQRSVVATAVAAAVTGMTFTPTAAIAQDDDEILIEEIVTVGIRPSILGSVDAKRMATLCPTSSTQAHWVSCPMSRLQIRLAAFPASRRSAIPDSRRSSTFAA